MTHVTKIGPTGEEGGELNIAVGHGKDGNVLVDFGTAIAWLAMTPPQATNLALALLGHAGARLSVNVDETMIARAVEFSQKPAPGASDTEYMRDLLEYALHGAPE